MNILPPFQCIDAIVERNAANHQWEPSRSSYTKGSLLPARLRVLVAMTQEETLFENPPTVVESSTEPAKEIISAIGAGFLHGDPSPLNSTTRGAALVPRLNKVIPFFQFIFLNVK
jgi:hypothetical protein